MDRPTMTQAQALARVEQLIKETVAVIRPEPRLDLYRPSLNVNSCLDPTDGGSEERVVINRSYYLRDIPRDQVGEVARQIKQHWERQGHYIEGVSKNGLNIAGRSQPDDFLISLASTGDDDVLNLGASSPCIWPNGTPGPSTTT
ncbi:hypothetical protein [Streptosporangium sp. NPDC003464]